MTDITKQEMKFTLTLNDANSILQALDTQPYKQVYGIIETIQKQISVQLDEAIKQQLKDQNRP